jgi:hypothetical protein
LSISLDGSALQRPDSSIGEKQMNQGAKDESNRHAPEAEDGAKKRADQATNDPALEAESKAEELAISTSLFLAPRQELLKIEAELKQQKEGTEQKKAG